MSLKPNAEDEQTEAIAAFIEALRPVKVGRGGYTRLDRYRDFKATFSSEHGKRAGPDRGPLRRPGPEHVRH